MLRRQERSGQLGNVEFKNEPVIKNSRSIFPLHSRYFSLHQEFKNEPVIKNSRANPSSRIQERTRHQEFQDQATNRRQERSRNEPVYDFNNCMDYRGWNRLSISYNPGELK